MRLVGPDNTYLTFRREIDWEIEGMGPPEERGYRPIPKFAIRSIGGGSKYARGKGFDITDAIYRIVVDGESLSSIGDIEKLDQDHMIIGDKTDCEATTNLTVGRVDQLLTIGVSSTDDESGKNRHVQFYISPEGERYNLNTDESSGLLLVKDSNNLWILHWRYRTIVIHNPPLISWIIIYHYFIILTIKIYSIQY